MLKKVLVTLILIVGVIAILRVRVDAHLAGYIFDGTWRHVASYNCVGNFRQAPDKNALMECQAYISEIQYTCLNPQGVETDGNNIRTDIVVVGGTSFKALDKQNGGTATVVVRMPEAAREFADDQCQIRNKLWHVGRELVLKVDVSVKTFDLVCADKGPCTNPTVRVAASEAWVHCDRPFDSNGTFYDLVSYPPPGNGVETLYPCFLVKQEHCDKFEGVCPITIDPSQFPSQIALREQPYNLNAGIHSLWNRARKAYGRL